MGGGFGPHRHEGTSPLPAYTPLAESFSPPKKDASNGGEGKGRAYELCTHGRFRRDVPKTKSGYVESFFVTGLRPLGYLQHFLGRGLRQRVVAWDTL